MMDSSVTLEPVGVYKVFEELSKELDGYLTKLDNVLKSGLPTLNQMLAGKQMKEI
ncbi:MAG: hypothetical protein MUE81_05255 [Thermoflexibacter sp.]|nr:hypothetical protein [Thermoflexibacter sp.]